MTKEQQNEAIAKVCGWELCRDGTHPDGTQRWKTVCPNGQTVSSVYDESLSLIHLPNYTSDLNAMFEAEKTLTIDQEAEYWTLLHQIAEADECTGHWLDLKATGHASAAARSEAFLKTLGLWED